MILVGRGFQFIAASAIAFLAGCRPQPPLEKFWPVPEFSLTERDGSGFDSKALAGKIWVADFFFASCPGVCPILNERMAELHREFAGEDRVRFVSITTDPLNDSPAALREYAARFGADRRWVFLTGEKEVIWELCRTGFKLPVAESPGSREPITHSTRIVLVDGEGVTRGFFETAGMPDARAVAGAIRVLLKEQK